MARLLISIIFVITHIITKLPTAIVKALTDLMRRFFWVKLEAKRYVAYISWDKITRPLLEGGLGIRDLVSMNEALMMKSLWGVATGSDSQWVSLVKARYFLRSFLWLSGDYNCTRFWRSLMQLRSKLAPMVCWDLGELECIVFGEPWYPQALELHPVNSKHSASKGENLYMGKGVKSLGMLMK